MDISFGEKIKNLRQEANLNQSELGKALHITQRKISYLECGQFEPSLDDLIAFCRFFHVTADYLLGLSDNKKNVK